MTNALSSLTTDVISSIIFEEPSDYLGDPDFNDKWYETLKMGTLSVPLFKQMPWAVRITGIKHDGLIRYRFFLNRERLLVASPKALSEVLVTKSHMFEKPTAISRTLGRILGTGVVFAEGDEHKLQRRNLLPAFHFRHMKNLYPIIWSKARESVFSMMELCGSDTSAVLEVSSWASRCALDIIGVAGMGVNFGAIQNGNSPLVATYAQISSPTMQAKVALVLANFLPPWLINLAPIKHNGDMQAAANHIRAVCRDVIRETKQKIALKEEASATFVSIALKGGCFSDEGLVDQAMTILAAGHATTATTLTWAVYLLSRFPDKQARLRAEVRQSLPSVKEGCQVMSGDIDRLAYLNAVCSEVLRTHTPTPITTREAVCDTTIQGQAVPKGTRIIIAPWGTNVDPSLWGDDADQFRPERWLLDGAGADAVAEQPDPLSGPAPRKAGGGATSNYAFLTFLHGPRSCLGAGFARAELACLLAAWVGRFEFTLADERLADERNLEMVSFLLAPKPAHGLHLRIKVVDGW
ncbi:Cytochrome P450 [Purpureocillium lavendulum]|uniref:Cytochrome P450 n=1 Tax=Purpureocillium lavendulum TaxID=1247861 RepID=A0AB34FEJ4_9HYPO|nr:Cytochrome P450 [Purpureocillium lavendulum]